MIFKANEAIGGWKHMSIGLGRLVWRRPVDRFVPNYLRTGLPADLRRNADGSPQTCPICGYAIVRLQLQDDWTLDVCSAEPVLNYTSQQFKDWLKALPREKLPTSCV